MQFLLEDENATLRFAQAMAAFFEVGDTVLLYGDLGTGKTSFARGVIQALAAEEVAVTSPTFTLMQSYDIVMNGQALGCWHVDLYRLERPQEVDELGLDALGAGLMLIEWPERMGDIPKHHIACHFTLVPGSGGRMVTVTLAGHPASRHTQVYHGLSASFPRA